MLMSVNLGPYWALSQSVRLCSAATCCSHTSFNMCHKDHKGWCPSLPAAFWPHTRWLLTSEDEKPKQKYAMTLYFFFFISEMLKHSSWKPSAVIRKTRHRSVEPNPTAEITKIFHFFLILIVLVVTSRGLSAGRSLSFPASRIYQPFVTASRFEAGGWGQFFDLCVVGFWKCVVKL